MLEAAGGVNVFADVDRESVQVTTEMVLARAARRDTSRYGGNDVAAARLERRCEARSLGPLASVPPSATSGSSVLTGKALTVPGPRVAEVAERMFQALHPPK